MLGGEVWIFGEIAGILMRFLLIIFNELDMWCKMRNFAYCEYEIL